ncbi:polyprenyl synthetase family protein [Streptomyces sp. RS10V-4]|uniref:polyprenyl synthetase family protein n=1 Tax=Streptomyces rhizoryzae TaxID=2932493 RepID=UPI00200303C5|nr:polyprenyl synthetase family protein [Streptomyces rhizoryzae]MCK7626624.1 polyprenyl synthetase family protein [Streptomyces rhizoryzae]
MSPNPPNPPNPPTPQTPPTTPASPSSPDESARTTPPPPPPGQQSEPAGRDPEEHIRSLFPHVRRHLADLVQRHYGARHPVLRTSLAALVEHGRRDPQEAALPLLVHAAISGRAAPAVPVAAAHALWWRSANTFDDVADGDAGTLMYGMDRGAAMTAALECGYGLPLRALAELPVPQALCRALSADYLDAWAAASDGQIRDLLHAPQQVGPEAVYEVYRKKSGAVYAMACAMAARLAHGTGAGPDGVAAWQECGEAVAAWYAFGEVLGALAQFRNDHDDLCGGPGADLRNGTATYLLVHLLTQSAPATRERALPLLEQAAQAESPRRQLTDLLLSPPVLDPYNQVLAELRRRAHTLLDTLAPASPYAEPLRARVDLNARPLRPRAVSLASQGRAPHGSLA